MKKVSLVSHLDLIHGNHKMEVALGLSEHRFDFGGIHFGKFSPCNRLNAVQGGLPTIQVGL